MKHEYGDKPIEDRYRENMKAIAHELDRFFNYNLQLQERDTGFILLVFPFGEKEGRCNYISNGASREDIVTLLREQANRFEETIKKEKFNK